MNVGGITESENHHLVIMRVINSPEKTKNAKTIGWKLDEEWNIYVISKHLPTKYFWLQRGSQSNSMMDLTSILIKGSRLLLAMRQIKLCAVW